MADPLVKQEVFARCLALNTEPRSESGGPFLVADSLPEVVDKLGLQYSASQVGRALRSLHCKGVIRCARPRQGLGENRPYELFLLNLSPSNL